MIIFSSEIIHFFYLCKERKIAVTHKWKIYDKNWKYLKASGLSLEDT